MTVTIPNGFHTWAASFICSGSTHNVVTTCGGDNGLGLTATSIADQVLNALQQVGNACSANAMSTQWTFDRFRLVANIGGVLNVEERQISVIGSGASLPPPINTAMIIKKQCFPSGRPYQARFFFPPMILEGNVDAAATLTPVQLASSQGIWTSTFDDLVTNGVDPVILHDDALLLAPTPITGFQVRNRLGTIGRRLRR